MKSKHSKGNNSSSKKVEPSSAVTSSPTPSINSAHRSNAFSFFKHRFFHNNSSSSIADSYEQTNNSPRPSIGSMQSTLHKPPIESKHSSVKTPSHDSLDASGSIHSSSSSSVAQRLNSKSRPVSMVGTETSLTPPAISTDALFRRNSVNTPTTVTAPALPEGASPFSTDMSSSSTLAGTKTLIDDEKRTSLIVLKEGYLFKKTDFKPFHKQSKLDRGWKLYKVVLKGHKLYLYKAVADSTIRSLFPTSTSSSATNANTKHQHLFQQQQSYTSSNASLSLPFSLSNTSISSPSPTVTLQPCTGRAPDAANHLILNKADFDQEAQATLFSKNDTAAYGAVFAELHPISLQPLKQACLTLTGDELYVCSCSCQTPNAWKIEKQFPVKLLKAEIFNELATSSPASINSMQSNTDYLTYKHQARSITDRRFSLIISHVHHSDSPSAPITSSVLGVYSTENKEIGQAWLSLFQTMQQKDSHGVTDAAGDFNDSRSQKSFGRNESFENDINATQPTASQGQQQTPQIFRSDHLVLGGTIPALIHELLSLCNENESGSNSSSVSDKEADHLHFLHVFLLTYPTFTSGSRVLNEFKKTLDTKADYILSIFRIWCREFALDVMGDVATGMVEIIDCIKTDKASQVKELVLETVAQNTMKSYEQKNASHLVSTLNRMSSSPAEEESTESEGDPSKDEVENISAYQPTNDKRRDSINLSNILINGLSPSLFLSIDPRSFAQQIYLFHYKKHCQYEKDLVNPLSYLPRPQLPIQMLNSLLFTTITPHFLTKIIRNHVLIDSTQEQQPDKRSNHSGSKHHLNQHQEYEAYILRSRLLEHWIQVGLGLFEMGDMTGWCAVAIGVCSVGIVRLRETWKAVDRQLVRMVQNEWVPLLTRYGLFTQNMWADEWKDKTILSRYAKVMNKTDIPNESDAACTTQSLPFFGTIRQCVDRFRRHTKKVLGPNTVNFEECETIHHLITCSLDDWKSHEKRHSVSLGSQSSLPVPVGPLQSFFEHSVTDLMSVPHDYKYLQECSLSCEPRIFGHGLDRRKYNHGYSQRSPSPLASTSSQRLSADPTTTSSSCLIFPNIVKSYHLLSSTQDNHTNLPSISAQRRPSNSSISINNHSATPAHNSTISVVNPSKSSKKTHPRLMGNNNSVRSLRSFLDDNIAAASAHPPKKQSVSDYLQQPNETDNKLPDSNYRTSAASATTKAPNRKAFRRRTFSLPPDTPPSDPSATTSTTVLAENANTHLTVNEADNTRTWFGSLISHRKSRAPLPFNIDNQPVGTDRHEDMLLPVEDDELILKSSLKQKKSQPDQKSKQRVIRKTDSRTWSVNFSKKDDLGEKDMDGENSTLEVYIKAGYLDRLVDTLMMGVSAYEEAVQEHYQLQSLAEGHLGDPNIKVSMNTEEYLVTFFMTYRVYCSPMHLLDMLRKRFIHAKSKCKSDTKKRKNSLILLETYFNPSTQATGASQTVETSLENEDIVTSYDWCKIANIQLRVLDVMFYWIKEHPYDFVDEVEMPRYISNILKHTKEALDEWCLPLRKEVEKDSLLVMEEEDTEEIGREMKQTLLEALNTADLVEQRIVQIREQFIQKSILPCYDMKAIEIDPECFRRAEELYRKLTNGSEHYYVKLITADNNKAIIPLSISTTTSSQDNTQCLIENCTADTLLRQIDRNVAQLFCAITIQDWIQTFDVLEAQSGDIYAWLPARKPSRTSLMPAALASVKNAPSAHSSNAYVLPDEVIISDIFTAIEGARRSVVSPSAYSDDDLLLALPRTVQYLFCMHYIIRSWVINEIAALSINSKTRVLRIEKFLQIIILNRMSTSSSVRATSTDKLDLFSELLNLSAKQPPPPTTAKKGARDYRIPGFVEYAIASALVSPEVRMFTRAWQDVAMQYGHASLDNLESLLDQKQKMETMVSSSTKASGQHQQPDETSAKGIPSVVPSLGWIFESILELCVHIPDTFEKRDNMIHFEKRRSMHQFLQYIMRAQSDLSALKHREQSSSIVIEISPRQMTHNWKDLREMAIRENKKSLVSGSSASSLVLRGATSGRTHVSRHSVFYKLVAEQMEKHKRDFKERDRIDKEWMSLQHKLQKKQLEQARLTEKQDRKGAAIGHQKSTSVLQQPQSQQQHVTVMPRLNNFLRGLRPQSMVAAPIQHIFPMSHSQDATQSSASIHLSTTKASTVINLIHSTTSIASTYTKRDFVFRIVTEEGGQYLFQAMHRDDMLDWMQQISNAAREGTVKRQSVLAAESMDLESQQQHEQQQQQQHDLPARRQVLGRTSVYGVTLETLMPDSKVPVVVEKCIREIEKRGLEEVGIYRVAGTGSIVSALKAAFNKNVNKVDLSDPQWADINVVADAFKQFLRELPEPLLTYTYYDEFITASAAGDHDERLYMLKRVIKKLPSCNYILLKRIIEHFVIVTDFEATNHMYATNLAIVFGPTLLQPAPGPASFATTMSNLGHHQNIVKYLILNYHYLFDIENEEAEPLAKDEEQPIASNVPAAESTEATILPVITTTEDASVSEGVHDKVDVPEFRHS